MLGLAATASQAKAKREFERLAAEYKELAQNAKPQPKKRA
jgi:hypothetical protein